jgi:hypothetical protein
VEEGEAVFSSDFLNLGPNSLDSFIRLSRLVLAFYLQVKYF